MPYTENM